MENNESNQQDTRTEFSKIYSNKRDLNPYQQKQLDLMQFRRLIYGIFCSITGFITLWMGGSLLLGSVSNESSKYGEYFGTVFLAAAALCFVTVAVIWKTEEQKFKQKNINPSLTTKPAFSPKVEAIIAFLFIAFVFYQFINW